MKNFTKAQKRLFLAHELFTKVDVIQIALKELKRIHETHNAIDGLDRCSKRMKIISEVKETLQLINNFKK